MRGRLIVFEGGDGIGKSHLASYLTEILSLAGVNARQLSFPGKRKGTLGQLVYALHHSPLHLGVESISPLALQALHVAAHLDEIATVIRPEIARGTWIILDRYWWSTWVYGIAEGADAACLELLIDAEKTFWGNLAPDAVFLVGRDAALRSEQTPERFVELSALYQQIFRRESEAQPTFELDNNDLNNSKGDLKSFVSKVLGEEGWNVDTE